MSLQVWLPLNKDARNQGLADVTVTNNGATFSNGCANFNGSSNYIACSNPNIDGSKISATCWVYMISTGSTNYFISLNNSSGFVDHEISLATDINNKIYFVAGGNSSLTYASMPLNTWTHLTVTFDGSKITGYVNGVNIGSISHSTKLNRTNLTVGARHNGSNAYTLFSNCKMYDVRIYDHCLSQKEVSEIAKGLVLHYKLDDPYVEPTINLINRIHSSNDKIESYGNGIKVLTNSEDAYCGLYFNGTLLTTKTYTLSFDVSMSDSDTCSFGFYGNGSMHNIKQIQNGRNFITFVPWADLTTALTFDDRRRSNLEPIYITNFQLEEKDHATPYTPSTREQGEISDCSGYGYDGIITGSLSVLDNSPRYNKCTNFITLNDSIELPSTITPLLTTCSVSFWILIDGMGSSGWLPFGGQTDAYYFMATRYGTGNFYHANIGSLTKTIYRDGVVATAPLNDGKWHHYVITGIDLHTWTKLYLNNYEDGSYWNFRGKVSDLRIYDTILSESDIRELYNTSAFIDNHSNLECYALVEDTTVPEVKKTGVVNTETFIERGADYLYLPAGAYVDTGLYIPASTATKCEAVLRYAPGGSGRDLMGYSASGAGYFGAKADGTWELPAQVTYTDADITKLNKIVYEYAGASNTSGNWQIGRLGTGTSTYYSVRNKYIYRVKLWKAGVLERDLYPASVGGQVGLIDILHYVFYPVQGTSGATLGDDANNDKVRFFTDRIESRGFLEI